MIRKNISLILAVGIAVLQCAKLSQPQEPKTILKNQTNLSKIQQTNQNNSTKIYNGCEYQKNLSNVTHAENV